MNSAGPLPGTPLVSPANIIGLLDFLLMKVLGWVFKVSKGNKFLFSMSICFEMQMYYKKCFFPKILNVTYLPTVWTINEVLGKKDYSMNYYFPSGLLLSYKGLLIS